jgi:hypothetical protein
VPKSYQYRRPGFFSRADLSESSRLSRRIIPNIADTEHEKLELTPGSHVVYAEDDRGAIYELTVFVPKDRDSTFPFEIAVKHVGRSD